MSTVAVVVARKGSRRIPGKAWAEIDGEGLVARKLRQLRDVPGVDMVLLGTDDEQLFPVAEMHGAEFFLRPARFCDEVSSTPNDMVRNVLSAFEADTVLWAHPTNPLIGPETYAAALGAFEQATAGPYDSLFSANALYGHFWHRNRPVNHHPWSPVHVVAANLPPVHAQNGGIFIRRYEEMAEDGRFVGDSPLLFPMDPITGWDIDEPWQLETARLLVTISQEKEPCGR